MSMEETHHYNIYIVCFIAVCFFVLFIQFVCFVLFEHRFVSFIFRADRILGQEKKKLYI